MVYNIHSVDIIKEKSIKGKFVFNNLRKKSE